MFYFLGLLAISILIESVANKWQVWLVAKLFTGAGVGSLRQSAIPKSLHDDIPCFSSFRREADVRLPLYRIHDPDLCDGNRAGQD